MVTELSKALSQIGTALPRVEIQLGLYRTDSMKIQVELLYAVIIQFYQRALKWYRSGKFRHVLAAFAKPYSLQFKDLRDKIKEYSRNIEKEAALCAQIELKNVSMYVQSNSDASSNILSLLLNMRAMIIG
jgi:hypothetical protein